MLVKLKDSSGFTLVELAMVLFIISLLLGGLMVPLSTKLDQERRATTRNALEETKESLLGYAVINGRLPCPDCPDGTVGNCNAVAAAERNDGIEDLEGAAPNMICRTNVGNLPWVDLQISAFDAWDRYYTYQVTPEFSRESNTAACGTPALNVSFEICTPGDIDIYDAYDNSATPYTGTPTVAENIVAIVVSHGADAYQPVQTDQEVENYGRKPVNAESGVDILSVYNSTDYTDNAYIFRGYEQDNSLSPPTRFDDIMMWISPNLLMNRMIISGALP